MSLPAITRVVSRLSRRRYGVIYGRELHELLTVSQIRTCVRSGLLERQGRDVFVNPSIPPSPEQHLAVAIGSAGAAWGQIAAAGHRSACALWAFVEDFPAVPEVVIPEERRIVGDGAVIRRSTGLDDRLVVVHRRLLVANPILSSRCSCSQLLRGRTSSPRRSCERAGGGDSVRRRSR